MLNLNKLISTFLLTLIIGSAAISACSMKSNGPKNGSPGDLSLILALPRGQSRAMGQDGLLIRPQSPGSLMVSAFNPVTTADFNCFGINVSGAAIRGNFNVNVSATERSCQEPGTPDPMFMAGLFGTGQSSVELLLPQGKHTIQVFGAYSETGNCPLIADLINDKSKDDVSEPYELGRASVDLFGDTSVDITAHFDPNHPKQLWSCKTPKYLLSAGKNFACASAFGTSVGCWGQGYEGQWGNLAAASPSPSATPVPQTVLTHCPADDGTNTHKCTSVSGDPVVTLRDVNRIVSGGSFSCAITMERTVRCWGVNGNGQMGQASNSPYYQLVANNLVMSAAGIPLTNVVALSAGNSFACAITDPYGKVYCWGQNDQYQAGHGSNSPTNQFMADTPVKIDAGANDLTGVLEITSGANHTCARLTSGAVKCWGGNNSILIHSSSCSTWSSGQYCAYATDVDTGFLPGGSAIKIAAGEYHTCALLSTGRVRCWGGFSNGERGVGPGTVSTTPTIGDYDYVELSDAVPLEGIRDIAASSTGDGATIHGYHTCAVKPLASGADELYCWGRNAYQQLGFDGTTDACATLGCYCAANGDCSKFARSVSFYGAPTRILSVALGGDTSCVLHHPIGLPSLKITCWGYNATYQTANLNASDYSFFTRTLEGVISP